jgi:hypothetical protein
MRWSLVAVAACMPEIDDAVVVRGRHVTVHADPAIPVCAEAVAVADRFVEDTAAMLGVAPRPIDYYLYDGPTGCDSGQYVDSSCVLDRTVYANQWIHFHELVHAVDDTHPPALFVEGIAEALSIRSEAARATTLSREDAQLVLESPRFRASEPHANYLIAGDFVRYLIERYGVTRYRALARALGSLADAITIRQTFARVYPVSLDEVIAGWRATSPTASTLVVPVDLVTCADPIAPIAPETWEIRDPGTSGCRSGVTSGGTVYVQHPRRHGFEVTEPGVFVVTLADDAGRKAIVRACSGVEHQTPIATGFTALVLGAGRHAIDVAEGTTAVRVARLGAEATACETAPAFAPGVDAWTLELRGGPGTWLRIDYAGSRELVGSAAAPTRACRSCALEDCRWFAAETPLDHAPGRPLYLQLGGADPASRAVFVGTVDGSQNVNPSRGPNTSTGSVAP